MSFNNSELVSIAGSIPICNFSLICRIVFIGAPGYRGFPFRPAILDVTEDKKVTLDAMERFRGAAG